MDIVQAFAALAASESALAATHAERAEALRQDKVREAAKWPQRGLPVDVGAALDRDIATAERLARVSRRRAEFAQQGLLVVSADELNDDAWRRRTMGLYLKLAHDSDHQVKSAAMMD
jgi:hypothetical protein